MPEKKEITISGKKDGSIKKAVEEIPTLKEIEIKAKETGDLTALAKRLQKDIPKEKTIDVKVKSDNLKIAEIKSKTDIIQKQFEFDAKVDIKQIEETSAIIQAKLEWDAKINIAQVEADAKKVEAIATSIGEIFKSTGDVMGGLFSLWADADMSSKMDLERWIGKEMELREKALEQQTKLTDATVENMKIQNKLAEKKMEAMEKGDALITVQGDGLAPHLEGFMWEILSAIQVRISESADDFLIGL